MTKRSIANPQNVSELCRECGLCCSGELFDAARVDEDELEAVRASGFDIRERSGDPSRRYAFVLPCRHLCGTACTIYSQPRPAVCGRFFCKLACSLDRDEVDLEQARETVAAARRKLSEISALLLPGEDWAKARARWRSMRPGPGMDRPTARFWVEMAGLNRWFDNHFRPDRKKSLARETLSADG